MKILRILWNVLCVTMAFLVGMKIIPQALNNLVDVDRYSGPLQRAIIMGSAEGFGLVLLFWVGCFCLSSPRWNTVSTLDRIILSIIGFVFLLGVMASIISSQEYVGRTDWIDVGTFGGTFLALAGPAILAGRGHVSLVQNILKKKGAKQIATERLQKNNETLIGSSSPVFQHQPNCRELHRKEA